MKHYHLVLRPLSPMCNIALKARGEARIPTNYYKYKTRRTRKNNQSPPRINERPAPLILFLPQNDLFQTNPKLAICYPPSETDRGLLWAAFAGSEGKYLFHRIGRKGKIWQLGIH